MAATPVKRRRKIWSCLECRRKKLSCDRSMPVCKRCVRAGKAASCVYLEEARVTRGDENDPSIRAGGSTSRSIDGIDGQASAAAGRETRIQRFGTTLAQAEGTSLLDDLSSKTAAALPIDLAGTSAHSAQAENNTSLLLRGGPFRTRFFGVTHSSALVTLVPGLHQFVSEGYERYPVMERVRQEIIDVEARALPIVTTTLPVDDADLRRLLPTRSESDRLITLYMDSFDQIYHIIHGPEFWRQYDHLWTDPQRVNSHFVIIVLLMMAVSLCLTIDHGASNVPDISTVHREQAAHILQSCESWLQARAYKYNTIEDFQIGLLLMIGIQLSSRRYKRTWASAGKLLRIFMGAGLHRDPDHLKSRISKTEKEMRRRLWGAITEFELQAAFEQGMLAIPWPAQSDALPPTNVADSAIEEPSAAGDETAYTSSSYLASAGVHIRLRHELNAVLNNVHRSLVFDEVRALSEEIECALDAVPIWPEGISVLATTLSRLNIYQYLLAVHLHFVQRAKTEVEKRISRSFLAETSVKVIQSHATVLQFGSHALELLYGDQIRAGLCFAYAYLTIESQRDHVMLIGMKNSFEDLMQQAIAMIGRRVTFYGGDSRQYWALLSARALMRLRSAPDKRARMMEAAVEEYTNLLSEAVANRKRRMLQAELSATTLPNETSSISAAVPPAIRMNTALAQEMNAELPQEINTWMLDDWNLDAWAVNGSNPSDWTSTDWFSTIN